MLVRFSLYGFLKNQQYFEPFLILVFLEKGLTFFEIGLLIAFREITVNLFEILTGAVADVYGRRSSMIASFGSYIVSFLVFGLADSVVWLFAAMFFFGLGEAFRTGTHKAMIFSWLRSQGRTDERTKVYGFTRSFSKLGSAFSVVVATIFVLVSDRFTPVFFLAMIPYAAGIINFLGYPKELDGIVEGQRKSPRQVFGHLRDSLVNAFGQNHLRRLLLESMGFEGTFKATKDYLQPVLQAAAIPLIAAFALDLSLGEPQRAAILIGPVYFCLFLMSAAASRNAHRWVKLLGGEHRAGRWLWGLFLLLFAVMLPAMLVELHWVIIIAYVVLFVLQNAWRPILMARIDSFCQESQGATVMSIENQSKSLATMIIAPILGALVDFARGGDWGGDFWPVAGCGLVVGAVFLLWPPPKTEQKECLE